MIAAFLTGLFGSLHCLGMCGPLVMALPGQSGARFWWGRLLYHSGRILTYSVMGGLVALLGVAAQMFALQQVVSLVMGLGLLSMAVLSFFNGSNSGSSWISKWVIRMAGKLLQKKTLGRLFGLGLVNGLLPCGMVYIGLFQAALAPSMIRGMATMALFGLGTWPIMMGLAVSGKWIRARFKSPPKFLVPGLMLTVGLMLTLRGMALGIPYLSPRMAMGGNGKVEIVCHDEAPRHVNAEKLPHCGNTE